MTYCYIDRLYYTSTHKSYISSYSQVNSYKYYALMCMCTRSHFPSHSSFSFSFLSVFLSLSFSFSLFGPSSHTLSLSYDNFVSRRPHFTISLPHSYPLYNLSLFSLSHSLSLTTIQCLSLSLSLSLTHTLFVSLYMSLNRNALMCD